MKKVLFLCTAVYMCFLFCSCATGRSASFTSEPSIKDGQVSLGDVQVVIDQVVEKQTASQIYLLTNNYLLSEVLNGTGTSILLDVQVSQRSFLQNAQIHNAIFFSFTFTDAVSNKPVAVITEYTSGSDTVLSANIQKKYIHKALSEYFKKKSNVSKK